MYVSIAYVRLCCRQLGFKPSRLYAIFRSILIVISTQIFILLYYSLFVFYLNYCCYSSVNIIVSLTSTPSRFQYELPFTIHSLLSQTELPKEIRVYLSPADEIRKWNNLTLGHLKLHVRHVDSSRVIAKLFDKLVRIRLEEQDYGPATKYLPIIKEFHSLKPNLSQSQAIIICDDDHYYQPHTIASLAKYSTEYMNSVIGFRGWRIRKDLQWGVGPGEVDYHIIQSYDISEIYRVGIVTANNAYLIRPSFFDSHIYLDFDQVSKDIQRVDDIWLNGHASKRGVPRFVIPACCASVSITRTHELENYLNAHQMSRATANNHALQYFNQSWEKDLWYRFKGENRPEYSSGLTYVFRTWIDTISRVKMIIYCGFSF